MHWYGVAATGASSPAIIGATNLNYCIKYGDFLILIVNLQVALFMLTGQARNCWWQWDILLNGWRLLQQSFGGRGIDA
jgi:hypothetical protein